MVWPVLITMVIQSLVSMVVYAPPVLAPVAHAQVGFPASTVGIVSALIYVAAMMAAMSAGNLIHRFGPLRTSQFSLLCCAIGIALIASANVWCIVLGALIIGSGYGVTTPSSSAILADRTPVSMRAFIYSVKQTGVPIGGALAGALIPLLMASFDWRVTALICGLCCFVLAVLVQPCRAGVDLVPHTSRPVATSNVLEPIKLLMSHPRLRELALASFSYAGMQMCLGSFLVVFLVEHLDLSVGRAGAALSVAMLAGAAARVLFGIVADNWLSPRILLGAIGATTACSAFAAAMMTPQWPYMGILAVSFFFGSSAIGWNGVFLSEVVRLAPAGTAGSATGASLAITYAGVVFLPTVFWAIVHFSGSYPVAFVAAGLFTLWRGAYFFQPGPDGK